MTPNFTTNLPPIIHKLLTNAKNHPNTPTKILLTGGYVRDTLLNKQNKDIDIEIHGINTQTLLQIAQQTGVTNNVGASFGIIKLTDPNTKETIDLSLPRTDSKTGPGHRGITTTTTPNLTLHQAAARRDLTINAIAYDLLTNTLHDPYGGIQDLQTKTIRAVNNQTFPEDPLRILRALRFTATLNATLHPDTAQMLTQNAHLLKEISAERIYEELLKILAAPTPSIGLRAGIQTKTLHHILPQITNLADTPQNPEHHPEGNALEHTLQTTDAAAIISARENLNNNDHNTLLLAALLHDIGKKPIWDQQQNAIGHDKKGAELATQLLTNLKCPKQQQKQIINLITNHMIIHNSRNKQNPDQIDLTPAATRRLDNRLQPATPQLLILLTEADNAGRNNQHEAHKQPQWAQNATKTLQQHYQGQTTIKNAITGNELINAGFKPGPEFKQLLQLANQLADEGQTNKQTIIQTLKQTNLGQKPKHQQTKQKT